MTLVIPKEKIRDFEDYRHYLTDTGLKHFEEVWTFKKKVGVLQEYVAVCYAKKETIRLNPGDERAVEQLAKSN
jgi:hypothetical protein